MTVLALSVRRQPGGRPRPMLRYHGGKYRMAPWIISHFPAHDTYVEPYGGAASVLLAKPRCRAEVYNDLDHRIVNVFRVVRNPATAQELRRRLMLTPFARAEFEWSYEDPIDPLDAAHKTIIQSYMGIGADAATRNDRPGFRAKRANATLPSSEWMSIERKTSPQAQCQKPGMRPRIAPWVPLPAPGAPKSRTVR